MAIAFARISYHSRSKGHSAVAGAAYRAGEVLTDERTGEQHDFKNRGDVAHSEILLPENADRKFLNRETLWNAVEAAEVRKNSQVAKDIVLALPHDLDLTHHIELARNFAHSHFVSKGVVADFSIHDHGDGNPHAHIYVTTRRLQGNQFERYKARDLEPDVARGRVVDPQYWGEQWREYQNRYFAKHDIDLMVDANHIFSQRHEGRIRYQKGHYLKEENILRREASVEIAVNDPSSVLNILGTKHAVFSDRDIALLLNKNTETQEQFETALHRLKAHKDLLLLGPGDDGRDRYTTRANYEREALMADRAIELSLLKNHTVSRSSITHAAREFSLNEEQKIALTYLGKGSDICAVVGRAGTGKSYMMRAALQMWEKEGYRVRGMAVSGIAAKGLQTDSGIPSQTIHSLKRQLTFGSVVLSDRDILVMDEAGMTDLNDLAHMVDQAKEAGAKLVLVGDHSQLQPIGPGAPFRAIIEQIGFSELNQIQRQQNPGDREASIFLSQGSVSEALDYYERENRIHLVSIMPDLSNGISSAKEDADEANNGNWGEHATITKLIADWQKGLSAENISNRLILAHRNCDVDALNKAARHAMQAQGLLGKTSNQVETAKGNLLLAAGDRILFLKNHRKLGLSNGEFATVKQIDNELITVLLGRNQERQLTFSTAEYQDFTRGYAATVHKSQGTTFDHTFVYIAGRAWDRFLTYVAMTRHKKTLNLYADQSQFKTVNEMKTVLSRASLKDSVLDWPVSFAIRRGFDPEGVIGRFIDKVVGVKQTIYDKWLFVVNYEAFKARKSHQQLLKNKAQQRLLARNVALFVDLRNGLNAQARMMRQDLKPDEKLYHHHDYTTYYEQSTLRNRLAFEISEQLPLFESALKLNRVRPESLTKMVENHERLLSVKAYLNNYKAELIDNRINLAKKIHSEFEKHYPHIVMQTKNFGEEAKNVVNQLNRDAISSVDQKQGLYRNKVIHEQPNSNINWLSKDYDTDFENLKLVKDLKIERLVDRRERLKLAKDKSQQLRYTKQLEYFAMDIVSSKAKRQKLRENAPNLAKAIITFSKWREKHVRLDRDL